jgi:hypothetical protein
MDHKSSLKHRLLEKSKLPKQACEEGHRICWKEVKVLQIEPNTTYRKYKESALMSLVAHLISHPNLDVSPIWTPSLKQKSEYYNSTQFGSYGKVMFLCWYYTDALFEYRFYFRLGPIWYLEIFACVNFNPWHICFISDFKGQCTMSQN